MAEKILVISGKGGVGKSSVSVGLANAMCSMGKSVLLVDADVGFRSLDLIMNIGSQVVYNWLDIIENRCSFSQAVVSGNGKPDLLSAPSDFSESITKKSVSDLLARADNDYDYVLVDSAAGADSLHEILAEVCDRALAVVTCDPVCVRSVDAAVGKVLKADKNIDIRMIVNRFDKYEVETGKQMKLDDVVDAARVGLIGVIPEDDSVRLLSGGSKISKYAFNAFLRTAKRISGESVLFNPKDFY